MIELLRVGIVINGGHMSTLAINEEKRVFETREAMETYRVELLAHVRPGIISGLIQAGVSRDEAEAKKIELNFKYRQL